MRGAVGTVAAALLMLAGCAGQSGDAVVEAHAGRTDDGWLLTAVATNTGTGPIAYKLGCHQAWDHVLQHQGEPVDMGVEACHAFEPATLEPGATHTLRIAWDGHIWGGGGREEAPPAAYVWRVSFLDEDGHALASDSAFVNKGQSVKQSP